MKILISELENAANAVGLRLKPCNDHHYQLIGGSKLVNFYVTNKGSSKIYVEGEPNGRFVNSVAQVIDATGAKQQSKPSAPANILEQNKELRTDIKTLCDWIHIVNSGAEPTNERTVKVGDVVNKYRVK